MRQVLIEARNLQREFDAGCVKALRGADFSVSEGEFVAIVGPSGSGKSTLFHIIGGLTPPTSGEVRVAGQDLAAMASMVSSAWLIMPNRLATTTTTLQSSSVIRSAMPPRPLTR